MLSIRLQSKGGCQRPDHSIVGGVLGCGNFCIAQLAYPLARAPGTSLGVLGGESQGG